jgi:pyrroline-5-carboxylate reductase
MSDYKLGMIGCGVMGEAILSRLIAQQLYIPSAIVVSAASTDRQTALAQKYGIKTTANNAEVFQATEAIVLAIKPQSFATVMTDLAMTDLAGMTRDDSPAMLLSILAGKTLAQLEAVFPDRPVIRVMPNTPAQVGAGVSAFAMGKQATLNHRERATRILQTVGSVVEVPESMMDAVTGLSGSGPGYVAIVIEALADGGVVAGLPRSVALQLAIQTVLGTATLLQESGMHPAQLKDQVTSPGGTTIAGIAQLEQQGLRSALIEAVRAATLRSRELGQ